jgi:hypothetical protein
MPSPARLESSPTRDLNESRSSSERNRIQTQAEEECQAAISNAASPKQSGLDRSNSGRSFRSPRQQKISLPIETKFSPNSIGQTLSPYDMQKAQADYKEIHKTDERLSKLENDFSGYISELTGGYQTVNNGSFGLRLNHGTSDLDLAIGVPPEDHDRVLTKLHEVGKFVGVRKSTDDSERHVFEFDRDGVTIDLGVLPPRDYALTKEGMEKCIAGMTENDRVTHTFMKKKLLAENRMAEYKTFKLLPYATYFSSRFNFVPIG